MSKLSWVGLGVALLVGGAWAALLAAGEGGGWVGLGCIGGWAFAALLALPPVDFHRFQRSDSGGATMEEALAALTWKHRVLMNLVAVSLPVWALRSKGTDVPGELWFFGGFAAPFVLFGFSLRGLLRMRAVLRREASNAPAPLAEWKNVEVHPDAILVSGEKVPYSDVNVLTYYRQATKVSVNFLPTGTDHAAALKIGFLGSRPPVILSAEPSKTKFPGTDSEAKAGRIADIYKFVSERTVDHRLQKYLHQLRGQGYFDYDEKRFFADGTIEGDGKRVNVHAHVLIRTPFRIEVHVPYSEDRWTRTKQKWSDSPSLFIITVDDEDCLLRLLTAGYGVEWVKQEGVVVGVSQNRLSAKKRSASEP